MKKNKMQSRICASLTGILVLLIICTTVVAQIPSGQPGGQVNKPININDDQKPMALIPWAIGGLLAVGVVAVGFKNAKRSHLD